MSAWRAARRRRAGAAVARSPGCPRRHLARGLRGALTARHRGASASRDAGDAMVLRRWRSHLDSLSLRAAWAPAQRIGWLVEEATPCRCASTVTRLFCLRSCPSPHFGPTPTPGWRWRSHSSPFRDPPRTWPSRPRLHASLGVCVRPRRSTCTDSSPSTRLASMTSGAMAPMNSEPSWPPSGWPSARIVAECSATRVAPPGLDCDARAGWRYRPSTAAGGSERCSLRMRLPGGSARACSACRSAPKRTTTPLGRSTELRLRRGGGALRASASCPAGAQRDG